MTDPRTVAERFRLPGPVRSVTPLGRGLINDSWLVADDRTRAVLQRINTRVFPRPDWIMANIRRVTDHLQGCRGLRLPRPLIAEDGRDLIEAAGAWWRLLEYVPGRTLSRLPDPETAEHLGWALGWLHRELAGLDPAGLHDTLPGFHITSRYLQAFDRALAAWQGPFSPALERACAFVRQRRRRAIGLERAGLPLRVVHGDPKLDNVLFDPERLQPLAWVDLDTLKPGLLLWDIGDCVRSACGVGGRFDRGLASALLSGWWRQVGATLTPEEAGWVAEAIWLLPFELGVRFLTDHLEGDRYFRVQAAGDNLNRALAQFALTADIERQWGGLRRDWEGISAMPRRGWV